MQLRALPVIKLRGCWRQDEEPSRQKEHGGSGEDVPNNGARPFHAKSPAVDEPQSSPEGVLAGLFTTVLELIQRSIQIVPGQQWYRERQYSSDEPEHLCFSSMEPVWESELG